MLDYVDYILNKPEVDVIELDKNDQMVINEEKDFLPENFDVESVAGYTSFLNNKMNEEFPEHYVRNMSRLIRKTVLETYMEIFNNISDKNNVTFIDIYKYAENDFRFKSKLNEALRNRSLNIKNYSKL